MAVRTRPATVKAAARIGRRRTVTARLPSPGSSVPPGAEEAQEEEEEVDEIEVEAESADDRPPRDPVVRSHGGHRLQTLRVPGRQPREDEDADDRDDELKGRRLPEEADDHRDHEADQPHEDELPDPGEAAAR